MVDLRRTNAVSPCFLAGLCCSLFVSFAAGADTPTRFLEALRDRGHSELAQEYLKRAADDPLVPEAFLQRLPTQRLETLYAEALRERDPKARLAALEALLPEARGLADKQELLTDLLDQAANAAADAARREVVAALRRPTPRDRAAAQAAVRPDLVAARERLAEAERRITAEQESLKGVKADSPEGLRRKALRQRLRLNQFQQGRLLHELAQTHPAGSAKRKSLEGQAAGELREVYEKYPKLDFGIYAHLYEGRCYRSLGEWQLALAALEDVTSLSDSLTPLRGVMTLAHAELAALWVDRGKPEKALAKPADWYEKLAPAERQGAEAGELGYRLGQAALAVAAQQEKKAADRSRRQAREWLSASAKTPHELQADARRLRAEVIASLGVAKGPAKDFAEAYQSGVEAIESMLALELQAESATGGERAKLEVQRNEARETAYEALTAAARLADDKTDPEQAARARYQLAWLDWKAGDAKQAATKAEYVARRDAETTSAEDAAKIALLALDRLTREGDPEAIERLTKFDAFVVKRWPGSEVAQIASSALISAALRSGDLETARGVVERASGEQRPELALRVAVAAWEREKGDDAFAQMDAAFAAVIAGGGEASPLTVTTALYLAQGALNRGDADKARGLLTSASYGPAKRLDTKQSPVDNPAIALATLRALTRSEALAGKRVEGTLDRIAAVLSETPAEKTGGPRAWLAAAADLYADTQRAAGNAKPSVAAALAATLDRLAEAGSPDDWNTRLWGAQARLRCQELLTDASAKQDNLAAAAEAFGGLVSQAQSDASFSPSKNALLAVRLRLAKCQRELGNYDEAMQAITAMLASGAVLLEIQQEAAATLQEWGVATDDPERIRQAIVGAQPGQDKKNLVWGWSKLASITGRYAAKDPKRRDQFFEAWRRVAACRYESAQLASGAERDKQLRKAASVILALQRQNPDLGGDDSRGRFDALLREIQTASGDQPTGLKRLGGA